MPLCSDCIQESEPVGSGDECDRCGQSISTPTTTVDVVFQAWLSKYRLTVEKREVAAQ